ncbi:uncharacterized protein LOC106079179 [Biomphalaria glabrata]|uniref:Uncharacterized protein LOC106079179 n=1 Tax=Biomphalaria glabrata TaxID=6526 RepID=A0A9U8ENN9_BIOGL|nr:uncharacterized protein LOC106079179 [Biomphalaria glabrata]
MGLNLSIESYCVDSSSKEKGDSRISLDGCLSKNHKFVTVYEGKRFYGGIEEEWVVAKFSRTNSTQEWAETQKKLSLLVAPIAEKYNKVLLGFNVKDGSVRFVEVNEARAHEVPFISRKRQEGQFFTYEKRMSKFKEFIGVDGKRLTTTKYRSTKNRSSLRKRSASALSSASCDLTVGRLEQAETKHSCVSPPPYSCDPPSYEQSEADAAEAAQLLRFNTLLAENHPEALGKVELFTCPELSPPARGTQPRLWESAPEFDSAPTTASDLTHGDLVFQENFLEAFIHYFFTHTEGRYIISSLKGSVNNHSKFTLTTPVIHSLTKDFCDRDDGEDGIVRVISNHRCNTLCRHLTDMNTLLAEAKRRVFA